VARGPQGEDLALLRPERRHPLEERSSLVAVRVGRRGLGGLVERERGGLPAHVREQLVARDDYEPADDGLALGLAAQDGSGATRPHGGQG
jgi:hypothetical protein